MSLLSSSSSTSTRRILTATELSKLLINNQLYEDEQDQNTKPKLIFILIGFISLLFIIISYALVSRNIHVLAEYTSSGLTGNFSTVSRVLLKKIPDSDSKCSYIYDKYVFHYIVVDGLTYLCMSDQDFNRPLAFQYLNDIKERFIHTYGERSKNAIAFAFNADFARVLQTQMDKYNSEGDPKITKIKQQLGEVKDAMMQNIDQVLQRGEKIELLVDKTEILEQHAFKFHRGARTLKRSMCMKNAKWMIVIVIVLALVIYFILALACKGADLPKCR